MKDKSQNPKRAFANSDIYSLHSEVKNERVHTTNDRILAGLMGNYLK